MNLLTDKPAMVVSSTIGKNALVSLHEDMERAIAAGEREYQRWSKGMLHTTNGKTYITEEIDAPESIKRMQRIARRIATRDEEAVHLATGKGLYGYGCLTYQLTHLGEAVLEICFETVPLIEHVYPGCRYRRHYPMGRNVAATNPQTVDLNRLEDLRADFNPYITVLLRACQKAIPALLRAGGKNLDTNDPEATKALANLLRFVRRACRSRKFKRIENNYARSEKKNFRSCCAYMAAHFARRSRLLVARVDLYITPQHKLWATTPDATRCIERYLRAVREGRIVPDVVAWICKRENGFRRGVHYHLLVVMDGHKHRLAGAYSRILGEAWDKKFSDGHGSHFNCWVRRHEYPLNCLGLVHISDRMMLLGLREAIKYMTKGDCQVRAGHARNLFRGIKPKQYGAVKRGAPRKAKHDMTLVKKILINL